MTSFKVFNARPACLFCFLSGLFVDVGNNYSVLDFTNISFIYDDIDERDPLNMNSSNPNELVLVN